MALATGLAVLPLIGIVGRLVMKIKQAVQTAQRNKRECKYLEERYLSLVIVMLPNLPPDQELAQPLAHLRSTLQEADVLVMDCQKPDVFLKVDKLLRANSYADRFREVNVRINSDLNFFILAGYTAITRRLDGGVIIHERRTMAPGSSSSSGYVAVQTQTPVSHVSSGGGSYDQPRKLRWAEIAAATDNLAVVIGGGRSGTVYRGCLHRQDVAVKVLRKHGRRLAMGDSFVAELEILFPLRHAHIARLIGWCTEGERPMFVYQHMSNGTLRDHLSGGGGSPVASSWRARLEVLLGAARALQHLHSHATRPVIHRNVSSSNILLDENWAPHLSDFGQALLQEAGEHGGGQGQLVPEAIGTFGYLDPEHYRTMRVSPASDVYSFGVVTLEVLTGRPHVNNNSVTLVSSVLPFIQNGKLRDVLDGLPALLPTPRQLEALQLVARTAARCLWPQGKDRPAMSNVVADLETALAIIRSDETNVLLCY